MDCTRLKKLAGYKPDPQNITCEVCGNRAIVDALVIEFEDRKVCDACAVWQQHVRVVLQYEPWRCQICLTPLSGRQTAACSPMCRDTLRNRGKRERRARKDESEPSAAAPKDMVCQVSSRRMTTLVTRDLSTGQVQSSREVRLFMPSSGWNHGIGANEHGQIKIDVLSGNKVLSRAELIVTELEDEDGNILTPNATIIDFRAELRWLDDWDARRRRQKRESYHRVKARKAEATTIG